MAIMENTLHFGKSGGEVEHNASGCLGLLSVDSNKLNVYFDGGSNDNDRVENTITASNHEEVVKEFVSLATRARVNTSDFTVIVDLDASNNMTADQIRLGGKGISDITAITIA
jgi:hypothetical protein